MTSVMDPDELRRGLASAQWTAIELIAETGSTNADLAAAARGGAPSGSVLITQDQRAGRGRFDRVWTAPAGTSIAMSVLVHSNQPAARWPWLPLVAGLAVADGLREVTGLSASVKWPNDVLVWGRKICGILAERVDTPTGPGAVLGMGINVSLTEEQLPVPTATSAKIEGSDATATQIVIGVLTALDRWYNRWSHGLEIWPDYVFRCDTVGRSVRVVLSPSQAVEGTAVGVDASGRLLVRVADQVRAFAAGDVQHLR